MEYVPKIVRERLKAAPPATDHPDANVLAAFAEASLSPIERRAVLLHLSRCVDCRDAIAFALPPTEIAQEAFSPSRTWLTWPALRWGFVAIGVVAIASVGIVEYRRAKSESPARLQTSVRPLTDEAKNQAPPPSPAAAPEKAEKSTANKDAGGLIAPNAEHATEPQRIDKPAGSVATVHRPLHGGSAGGPVQANTVNSSLGWQQQNIQQQSSPSNAANAYSIAAPAAPAPIPPVAQALRLAPQPNASEQQAQAADLTIARNQAATPTAHDEARISRSKPSETVEVASAAPLAESSDNGDARQEMPKVTGEAVNGRNFTALVALRPTSQLRWTISASGSVQRSDDQGSTWHDVNIISGLIPTSNFARDDAAGAAVAKAKKSEKSVRKRELASPAFRAVTAAGSDVWAGGSNAALYHSTDSGDHWMQVLPSSAGVALTGDVVGIEFPDPQHGRVRTSTPETWTTSDAGQTWQRQ